MDEQQKELVRASFEAVAPGREEFAGKFYARLFEIAPDLRRLFKGDMAEQGRKLTAMLAVAVANLDRLETVVPAVRALGERHAGYGVKDGDYATVAEALLWTFQTTLGRAFGTATRDAWAALYAIVAGQMMEAARAASAARGPLLKTWLTQDYGVDHPLVNAGMAFIATSKLASAVCRAGGLGTIGCAAMSPEYLREEIGRIRSATNHAFGVDIIPRFSPPEHIEVLVQEKVPLVIFFWDDVPDAWISDLHGAGAKVWMQIGSVDEARRAIEQGVDGLVVQGSAAGGHNRSSAELVSFLPAICDMAGDLLLIAAGGIADGRGIAAALALGADGVWVGTRLLASEEADAHPEYKRRVLEASVADTARHNVFGPEFPDATVRGLRNRIVREWEGRDHPAPYQAAAPETLPVVGEADLYGQKMPMTRFCGFPPTAAFTGDFEEMSLLAGELVGQTRTLAPAADIVTEMMTDAAAIIRGRLMGMVTG